MSEAAVKRMTVSEFLRWEDGSDTRYELLGGLPVAMAPSPVAQGMLAAHLCGRDWVGPAVATAWRGVAQIGAVITCPGRDDTCYIPDFAVSGTLPKHGEQLVEDSLASIGPSVTLADLYGWGDITVS
jgi:hypothetical protein